MGMSVDGSSFYLTNSDDVILAAYGLPFVVILVVVVIVCLGVFFMCLDEQVASIKESNIYISGKLYFFDFALHYIHSVHHYIRYSVLGIAQRHSNSDTTNYNTW